MDADDSGNEDTNNPLFELNAEISCHGGPAWYFPGARDHGHADALARVFRRDGSSWLACLTVSGFTLVQDCIFAMPCPEQIFLNDGVAHRDDPTSWRPLQVGPAYQTLWSEDRKVVVFAAPTAMEAHGTQGLLWFRPDYAVDFALLAIAQDRLLLDVYVPETGEWAETTLDLLTGQDTTVTGGT